MKTSRRKFLIRGSAGIAGAALLSGCAPQRTRPEVGRSAPPQPVRTLGRTGLELPAVGMGSIYAINLVHEALDRGVVYIHTSSSYSERNHERLLGDVFRDRPRDSFVIGTSPDLPYNYRRGRGRSMDLGTEVDPGLIVESIEGSLQRLGLDSVDIYYLVSIGSRETVLHEPYIEVFDRLKREGKIRFAGVGTHANEPEVIRAAAESGFWDVVLTSYNFRQRHQREVADAIAVAAQAGLGVVAMKTQAGVYWDRSHTEMINMKAALKWVLQDPNVHTTIPAISTYEELEEDLSILEELELTPEERRDLRLDGTQARAGLYCQQCGDCMKQCAAGMETPALMRAYMYAFGHREREQARNAVRGLRPEQVACAACERCTVRCPAGIDVRSRAMEMAGLLENSRKPAIDSVT